MSYCENCGTKLDHGLCPNCYEDLFIEAECDEFDIPISKEFSERCNELREQLKEEKRNGKGYRIY